MLFRETKTCIICFIAIKIKKRTLTNAKNRLVAYIRTSFAKTSPFSDDKIRFAARAIAI